MFEETGTLTQARDARNLSEGRKKFLAAGLKPFVWNPLEEPRYADISGGVNLTTRMPGDELHLVSECVSVCLEYGPLSVRIPFISRFLFAQLGEGLFQKAIHALRDLILQQHGARPDTPGATGAAGKYKPTRRSRAAEAVVIHR